MVYFLRCLGDCSHFHFFCYFWKLIRSETRWYFYMYLRPRKMWNKSENKISFGKSQPHVLKFSGSKRISRKSGGKIRMTDSWIWGSFFFLILRNSFASPPSLIHVMCITLFLACCIEMMAKNLPTMQEAWIWILGLRRSSGERYGNPLQYSCLENSMERGVWQATVLQGCKESDTTERLTLSPFS